ncbi:hypothetical protein VNO77_02525 [Canavalia gladiata]|uniref:Uncharacterized protein n=1 Tax=Canavalia gladiata TaxID=3824 RepID=A0AAN9MY54_CANGL
MVHIQFSPPVMAPCMHAVGEGVYLKPLDLVNLPLGYKTGRDDQDDDRFYCTRGRRRRPECKRAFSNGRRARWGNNQSKKGGVPSPRVQLLPFGYRAQLMLASGLGRKVYPTVPVIAIKPSQSL